MPTKPIAPQSMDLELLVKQFYSSPTDLAAFAQVSASQMPPVAERLLNHDHHMTVGMESHHRSMVDVEVIRSRSEAQTYSREILLRRQRDSAVVQYGLVWMDKLSLPETVVAEIEQEQQPLGRILIENQVMREVSLLELYRLKQGPALAFLLGGSIGQQTFGRTAMIRCNGAAAIYLLEVLSNVSLGEVPTS